MSSSDEVRVIVRDASQGMGGPACAKALLLAEASQIGIAKAVARKVARMPLINAIVVKDCFIHTHLQDG